MERKKILGIIVLVLVMVLVIIEASIARALLSYGFSIKELPRTSEVYFRISKGYTVSSTVDGSTSKFIGRNDIAYYDELFAKKGFHKLYDYDGVSYYSDDGKTEDFRFNRTEYFCRWFAEYEISADHEIEFFIK